MPQPLNLSELYRRHAPPVFRRARSLLRSEAAAHEVVQDLFLSLLENPEQFSGQSSLTTFLYGATTHACLNKIRNQKNRDRLRQERSEELVSQHERRELSPEQRLIVQRALRDMPEELAQVAVYHFMDGLTQDEVAGVLECSRRHVGNLLQRLREWTADNTPDSEPLLSRSTPC